MNPIKLLFGFIITAIGIIFLGITMRWWDTSVWNYTLQFWPLILILVGLWFIIRNVVAFMIIALVILIALGIAIAQNRLPLPNNDQSRDFNFFAPEITSNETASFVKEVPTDSDDTVALRLAGRYNIKIVGDATDSVRVNLTGPKVLIDSLQLEKEGNEVKLDEARQGIRIGIFRGLSTVTGTITIPQDNPLALDLSGFNQLEVSNHNNKLGLDISGSTTAHFVHSNSHDPTIEISGSAKINLDNCQGKAEIEVSGSGGVEANSCNLDTLRIRSSGSGNVTIKAGTLKDLDVQTSGSSRITIPRPSGNVQQSNSGSSTINYNQ